MRERETIEAISRRSIWVVRNSALDRQKEKKIGSKNKIKMLFGTESLLPYFHREFCFKNCRVMYSLRGQKSCLLFVEIMYQSLRSILDSGKE